MGMSVREELQKRNNQVVDVVGTFDKFGIKKSPTGNWLTVLLKDVKFMDGSHACDHLWFVVDKDLLMNTEIRQSAKIIVHGVVSVYRRKDGTYDFGISKYKYAGVIEAGEDIVPAKSWKYGRYFYCKFITGEGTKWFRCDQNTKLVQRVVFKKRLNGFDEIPVMVSKSDIELVKHTLKMADKEDKIANR